MKIAMSMEEVLGMVRQHIKDYEDVFAPPGFVGELQCDWGLDGGDRVSHLVIEANDDSEFDKRYAPDANRMRRANVSRRRKQLAELVRRIDDLEAKHSALESRCARLQSALVGAFACFSVKYKAAFGEP